MARHDADPGRGREPLGLELVAHQADGAGRRPDEDDPFGLERLGEGRVLGQEAVARMDRLGAGPARRVDDRSRSGDSSRRPAAGRSRPPRRPCGRAARRHRPRNGPRPSRCRAAGRSGSPGRRSRRGWRSGFSRTWRSARSRLPPQAGSNGLRMAAPVSGRSPGRCASRGEPSGAWRGRRDQPVDRPDRATRVRSDPTPPRSADRCR